MTVKSDLPMSWNGEVVAQAIPVTFTPSDAACTAGMTSYIPITFPFPTPQPPAACPCCGRCPNCGQQARPMFPYPQTFPYAPTWYPPMQPYWMVDPYTTVTYGVTGMNGIS